MHSTDFMDQWDFTVFGAMLLISGLIGVYFAFFAGQETELDFLMAGRQMNAFPVSLSLSASFMSSLTLLGMPADVYLHGAKSILGVFSFLIVVFISAEIFLPIFYRLQITSTYEYLELRFNKQVRLVGTFFFIFQMVIYTGLVIYGPAIAISKVIGIGFWTEIIGTGLLCTVYCSLLVVWRLLHGIFSNSSVSGFREGGLRAVIWTDAFQFSIMVIGYASLIVQSSLHDEGLGRIFRISKEGGRLEIWDFNPSPFRTHTFWTFMIGGTLTWTSIFGINHSQVQRYLCCKSQFQAKLALYINLLWLWTIVSCTVFCGLAMYTTFRGCDPLLSERIQESNELMIYLAVEILDFRGSLGLFVAAAYSGSLSTISSSINSLALVTIEDFIKPLLNNPSERTLSLISKVICLFYGILCIMIAALESLAESILQIANTIFGLVGGPLLGLFSLGMFTSWANAKGSLFGLLIGFVISAWMGVGNYWYPVPPEKVETLAPVSIENCSRINSIYTESMRVPEKLDLISWKASAIPSPEVPSIFWISYLYIGPIGTFVTLIVGSLVSFLTGGKYQEVNEECLLRRDDTIFGSWCKRTNSFPLLSDEKARETNIMNANEKEVPETFN
ncbi:sodium-coupled monocarboxylate transporter 1-like isoform X1 [Monodelphis domestica]|uniref:sodium-coupled monocarboxylate transporter 1-like isoform X1 n=1 Tax=Monodelphis domestica TaxID=13616 RepID=UPI0024E218F5|nr:sodium-coupled monocarboxylate transporter 1-like isoform X1 [Monodelphis domestica]